MPETAGMANKKAPAVKTDYDLLAGADSQAEYYKLKIAEMRMKNAASGLTKAEKKAMELASDLDVLTAKILVKLKILPDFHPELNTMRAITGMEAREDIARELAVKHYNKAVVDRFVSKYVSVAGANDVLDEQQSSVRDAIAGSLGYAAPSATTGGDGKFAKGAFDGLASLLGLGGAKDD
jgi:hypothetical protein